MEDIKFLKLINKYHFEEVIGIIVGKGVRSKNYDKDLLKHEFGHILQSRLVGYRTYYGFIGVNSLVSAYNDGKNGWKHDVFWTETYANYLARNYFGRQAFNNGWDSFYWNYKDYPAENISPENLLKLH
jgi:hypothetical protein